MTVRVSVCHLRAAAKEKESRVCVNTDGLRDGGRGRISSRHEVQNDIAKRRVFVLSKRDRKIRREFGGADARDGVARLDGRRSADFPGPGLSFFAPRLRADYREKTSDSNRKHTRTVPKTRRKTDPNSGFCLGGLERYRSFGKHPVYNMHTRVFNS